jgi:predicted TIM-barrel fold metal-dependent hydrolase
MNIKNFLGLFLFLFFLSACTSNLSDDNDDFIIINAHEHIESFNQSDTFLKSMDKDNVSKTILLGSPYQTLYVGRPGIFTGYDWNNEEVMKIVETYPDRFYAFPTIYPKDPEKLEKFKALVERGAHGLKLYSGHTLFYEGSLNEPSMFPVYEYCEENNIPILFHINPAKFDHLQTLNDILTRYPKLKINCPHFCLSSIKIDRVEKLMDDHSNLYTDISFGFFVEPGLRRISRNPKKYRAFFEKYQDRIMFGTDMVVTSHRRKTVDWISNLTMCYRDMLEKPEYTCIVGKDYGGNYKGLNLSKSVLKNVYQTSTERFLSKN